MSKIYGAIRNGSHPMTTRGVQRAENCTMDVQILGNYFDLENIVLNRGVGDDASSICTNSQGDFFDGYKIKNLSVAREEGEIGVLSANLVKVNSINKPYHITFTVDMLEDQRNLLRHPLFRANPKSFNIIRQWMDTPMAERVVYDEKDPTKDVYKYRVYKESSVSEGSDTSVSFGVKLEEIKDEVALKYCKTFVAGLETYNVYLPVVTKVSLYLKQPPGVTQDNDSHEVSGNLEFSKGIGQWDNSFGFTIAGYEESPKQGWFKNQDQWVQNSDGTWQRTEQWTFSDSKEHAWIYQPVSGGSNK